MFNNRPQGRLLPPMGWLVPLLNTCKSEMVQGFRMAMVVLGALP